MQPIPDAGLNWMTMMMLIVVPAFVLGIIQLVCFVLVLVQMFQRGETGMGIACIALVLCGGLGGLFAFIYGWVKSSQWGLKKVMITWTVCFVLNLVIVVGLAAASVGFATQQQPVVRVVPQTLTYCPSYADPWPER